MKNDIWMPFYIGDYLRDTMHLTTEQHGAYLLLILHYWIHGPLPDDDLTLRSTLRCSSDASWEAMRKALSGFFIIKDGKWFHKRIDKEMADAQANSIKKKARTAAATAAKKNVTTIVTTNVTSPPSPSPSYSREREYAERPSLEEVLAKAEMIGLASWKAEDWFHEMQGCGWLDFQHRPVIEWQSVMIRVRKKWESDGRPAHPPTSKYNGKSVVSDDIKNQSALVRVEERLKVIRGQFPLGECDPLKEELKDLKLERERLKKTLGFKA